MNILIEKNIMVPMRDGVKLATDVYRPAVGGLVPVLFAGEGKALQIGGGGLGVVFKLFGTDTGGRFAVVEHPLAPGILAGPPIFITRRTRPRMYWKGKSWHKSAIS